MIKDGVKQVELGNAGPASEKRPLRRVAYKYDFSLFVAGPGRQIQGKTFAANESNNEDSRKYNVFDMHSVRYREILEQMFADPAITAALQNEPSLGSAFEPLLAARQFSAAEERLERR